MSIQLFGILQQTHTSDVELDLCLQVSDRTKTSEELAELERLRLEALEKQRLKRMTAAAGTEIGDADEADAKPAQAAGGYAARRQKRQKLMMEADGPSGEDSCHAQ